MKHTYKRHRKPADFALADDSENFVQEGKIVNLQGIPLKLLQILYARRGKLVSYRTLLQ
jgi:hypothetical protein